MLYPKLLVALLIIIQTSTIQCNRTNRLRFDVKPLSRVEQRRLKSWTEDSKENIWELSGQFEGDIVLSAAQRNGFLNPISRWPNKEVPFKFDANFNSEQEKWITEVLSEFHEKTCVKIRLATPADKDYVLISNEGARCYSRVGRIGGQQIVNLGGNTPGRGCLRRGTIIHEFLHTLGFVHLQSSTERNEYITINWENIIPKNKRNFKRYSSSILDNFGQKYDYGSVLHYSEYAFSTNGERTIIPKDPTAQIGQRKGFSEIDLIKVNKMYKC